LFKAGKMYFPEEMKTQQDHGSLLGQIRMATKNGLKGKDDCIDTISMLYAWKPRTRQPAWTTVDPIGSGRMKIVDLFRQLSFGELSNLALGNSGSGTIVDEKQPQLVQYVNACAAHAAQPVPAL
jgi:hypothetical protein